MLTFKINRLFISLLSIAIFISGVLAILFRTRSNLKLYAVFKPLTTVLIIILALFVHLKLSGSYQLFVLIALVFALIGDIFLLRKKWFLYGIIAFSLAHLCFTAAFVSLYGFSLSLLPLIILLIFGLLIYIFLKNDLHKYAIPVAFYILIIILMVWQAVGLLYQSEAPVFWALGGAAILFLFSDFVIAYNKFKQSFEAAEPLILSTYWTAVYVFALAGTYIS